MRAVLSAEVAAIRRRDPDLNAGDITTFTFPLMLRLVGVLAVGLVPLMVIRSGGDTDALLVPLVGSLALAIICTAVVAWLVSIVISGLVVMVLYRTGPRASSQVVVRTLTESFERVSDATSHIMLLALVAGLVSLAIGLPTRPGDELANSVLEDLLAAQVAVLLAALGFAFVAESIRCAADIVDDQSMMLAWPWALIIACVSWMLATTIGLRDHADADHPAERMAAGDGRRDTAGRGHPGRGALGRSVVGGVGAAADYRRGLGVRGMAARRLHACPRFPRR